MTAADQYVDRATFLPYDREVDLDTQVVEQYLTLVEQMPGITEDASDTPFIIFGNLSHLYIGDRRRMTMAQSQHVGFTSDKIFLRVIQREAIQVAIPDAFAVIRTAA